MFSRERVNKSAYLGLTTDGVFREDIIRLIFYLYAGITDWKLEKSRANTTMLCHEIQILSSF